MAAPQEPTETVHVPAWKLLFKTCLTLWLVELGIMVALPWLEALPHPWMVALVDGALVTLFACPLAYLWVFGFDDLRSHINGAGALTAFVRFGVVVLVVEVAIMTCLPLIELTLPGWGFALFDATLLATLSAPFIPVAVRANHTRGEWKSFLPHMTGTLLDFAPTLGAKITGVATLCTLLAVGATVWMSFGAASELLLQGAVDSMDTAAARQAERLDAANQRVRLDAAHMSLDEAVTGFLNARGQSWEPGLAAEVWEDRLEYALTGLLESKGYWQVRLIDLRGEGMELARVERDPTTGEVRVAPRAQLQNKGATEYVASGRSLLPGEIHASSISLNREHGTISLPRTPTQRFVAPIYLQQQDGDSELDLTGLVQQIRYLDEALTMSAVAASQSGDPTWKERYDEHADQLDLSLAQVIDNGSAEQRGAASRISQDNAALIQMELEAFELVADGSDPRARALLKSQRYKTLKTGYATNLDELVATLRPDVGPTGPDALIVINTFATALLHEALDTDSALRVELANDSGGYIHHTEVGLEWQFDERPMNQLEERHPEIWALAQESGDGRVSGTLGDTFFVAEHVALNPEIGDSGIWVLLLGNRAEVLSGVQQLKANLTLLAGLAILVSGCICSLTLKRLTRPIKDLTLGAGRIAQGAQDVQLPTAGNDEVGQLGRALSDLIAKLQERTKVADRKSEEVKELNDNLEAEVMRRTARLIASEARLNTIMNSAGDAFISVGDDGLVQFWNEAAAEMFGATPAEVMGTDVARFIPEEFRAAHRAGFARFMVTGESAMMGKAVSVEAQRCDGTRFPVNLTLTAAPTDDGTLVVAIIHDLTEEQALQVELDQARKLEAIGSLAAGVAHEINTPTQYVTDNVQFLEESCGSLVALAQGVLKCMEAQADSEDPALEALGKQAKDADLEFLVDEVPRAFEQSIEGLTSIMKIVRAMKEFSHPGSEDKGLADLARIIENTTTVGRNEWKYCAELELVLDPELPLVPCVTGDLGQVLLNLVVNAAHAIEERREAERQADKGIITIRATLCDPWVEIRVEDTGCGMTREVSERIFEPFFTTKDVGKGTGQGLAIAHTIIVERHGGTLTVESEPGVGTVFVMRLPLEDVEVSA